MNEMKQTDQPRWTYVVTAWTYYGEEAAKKYVVEVLGSFSKAADAVLVARGAERHFKQTTPTVVAYSITIWETQVDAEEDGIVHRSFNMSVEQCSIVAQEMDRWEKDPAPEAKP